MFPRLRDGSTCECTNVTNGDSQYDWLIFLCLGEYQWLSTNCHPPLALLSFEVQVLHSSPCTTLQYCTWSQPPQLVQVAAGCRWSTWSQLPQLVPVAAGCRQCTWRASHHSWSQLPCPLTCHRGSVLADPKKMTKSPMGSVLADPKKWLSHQWGFAQGKTKKTALSLRGVPPNMEKLRRVFNSRPSSENVCLQRKFLSLHLFI